ncbi:MAG: carbon-nitrogen hydrolase family protein [FCB group bacterium]|nr:carbon-nitrogen hydrolase family protein [FCB group bacterium]
MKHTFLLSVLLLTLSRGGGLVSVIQPQLTEQDYRSVQSFYQALLPYVRDSQTNRQSGEPSLLIFPEYIGAWLVAVNGCDRVFKADNLNSAMIWIILAHPVKFISSFIHTYTRDHFSGPVMGHVERAIFKMQAESALKAYVDVFGKFAREVDTWIVAGSILLPEVNYGETIALRKRSPHLYNQSMLFNPDGAVVSITRKAFPVGQELDFLDRGQLADLPVVSTPLGRLGIMICADSWHPECYARLDSLEADLLIVPSLVNQAERWISVWGGYDPPEDDPGDVDPEDLNGNTRERDMWKKYALKGRMTATSAPWGFNSFLGGEFWGLTGAGQSNIIHRGEIFQELEDYRSDGVITLRIP